MPFKILQYGWFDDGAMGNVSIKCRYCNKVFKEDYLAEGFSVECPNCRVKAIYKGYTVEFIFWEVFENDVSD